MGRQTRIEIMTNLSENFKMVAILIGYFVCIFMLYKNLNKSILNSVVPPASFTMINNEVIVKNEA